MRQDEFEDVPDFEEVFREEEVGFLKLSSNLGFQLDMVLKCLNVQFST